MADRWSGFAADTLNGVPSIVIGVFVYGDRGAAVQAVQRACRRPRARHHDDSHHRADDRGAAAAGAGHDARGRAGARRHAGAARSSRVVLPAALPGIITGVVLALARIAGETAPLLFTSFNNRFFTTSLGQPIVVADGAGLSPTRSRRYEDWHRQAWAGALVPRRAGPSRARSPPGWRPAGFRGCMDAERRNFSDRLEVTWQE